MIDAVERRRSLLPLAQLQSTASQPAGPHPVSQVKAFAMRPSGTGNSYTLLQIRTQSGLIGYGECKPLSVADLEITRQAITGRPSSAYEALGSAVPQNARAGLNMALLDILGKATKAPVYRVLGGPTRNRARAIARLAGSSDDELEQDLQKQLASGFRAFLVPIPTPEARNQGSAFVQAAVTRFKAMRRAAPDADFAFEAGDRLTPGDSFEPCRRRRDHASSVVRSALSCLQSLHPA